MSEDARTIFPIETVLEVIADQKNDTVREFLSFAVRKNVSPESAFVVAPLVKGWLYSLNPGLMASQYSEETAINLWIEEQKKKFSDKISVEPMNAKSTEGLTELLERIDVLKQEAVAQRTACEEAKAQFEEVAPIVAKAADLEKKVASLEEKNSAQAEEISALNASLAEFSGKIALDEADIASAVKDLVGKAVKEALATLPRPSAPTQGAASGGQQQPAAAPAVSSGPADFMSGFGSSFDDPFGGGATQESAPATASAEPQAPAEEFGFGTTSNDDCGFGF